MSIDWEFVLIGILVVSQLGALILNIRSFKRRKFDCKSAPCFGEGFFKLEG